jgi:hypothetical protein
MAVRDSLRTWHDFLLAGTALILLFEEKAAKSGNLLRLEATGP